MMHVTVQQGETNGTCKCGTRTLLVSPNSYWNIHETDDKAEDQYDYDEVEVREELTAHYCPTCHTITSLSFNAPGEQP